MESPKERATERIVELAARGLDLVTFWQEVREPITRAVPHFVAPCWFTLDPASLLVTSHYDHDEIPELPPEWLAHEYFEDDFHKMADVARSERGISTLDEATGGDPSRSEMYKRYLEPYGAEQELLLALRTRQGETWGVLGLYREQGQPQFEEEQLDFLSELAPFLARGAQRGLLLGEASDPEGPESPGLIVLSDSWSVESMSAGVELWLADLPGGDDWETKRKLPPAVLSVAGQALRSVDGNGAGEVAFARVLTRTGRWMVLHGATLAGQRRGRVAVIIEPAHPARISSLLMAAYQLTEREQSVTRLVLQGESTTQIAEALVVSPHTVQEHLKKIFDKTGVRSRRELVGKIFFSHYEPRLRDNEHRALERQPLRGGPVPP